MSDDEPITLLGGRVVIKTNPDIPPEKIYLITQATADELLSGDYLDIDGLKISSNPKKHAVITNVKR